MRRRERCGCAPAACEGGMKNGRLYARLLFRHQCSRVFDRLAQDNAAIDLNKRSVFVKIARSTIPGSRRALAGRRGPKGGRRGAFLLRQSLTKTADVY